MVDIVGSKKKVGFHEIGSMQESSSVSQSEERVCDKKTVRVRSKSEHSTSSSSTTDYQSSTVKSGRSLLQEITQVHSSSLKLLFL